MAFRLGRDAAGHQDGGRPGPESVSSPDQPQLQPRFHHASARTDGLLALPDARSLPGGWEGGGGGRQGLALFFSH